MAVAMQLFMYRGSSWVNPDPLRRHQSFVKVHLRRYDRSQRVEVTAHL